MLSLDRLLSESERLDPVPQIIHQLMDLVNDPEAPMSEITELILYEPVVTANLLKLANSAAFGLKTKVNSVHDAVVFLGLKRVVDLVLLNSVSSSLIMAYQGYGLEEGRLWKQSVSCALIASAIAESIDAPTKHSVFTAALLKDIAVIVMDRHMSKAVDSIRQAITDNHLDLVSAERKILGIDHAYLGGQMANKWNFSQSLVSTITDHHLVDPPKSIEPMTGMVYLADCMCSMSGINADLFSGHYTHYDTVCDHLGLTEADANQIMSDFYAQKENIYGLLAIL